MGARQRAQKRGKNVKGSQKGTPVSQKKLNQSIYVPDLSPVTRSNALLGWQEFSASSSLSDRRDITMGDTARNTERHVNGWGQSKLRDQGISFVSAGTLHQDPENIRAQGDQPEESQRSDIKATLETNGTEPTNDVVAPNPEINVVPAPHQEVFREEPTSDAQPFNNRQRSASSSSSEAEQIVFKGRSTGPSSNAALADVLKNTSRLQSVAKPSPISEDVASITVVSERSTVKPASTVRNKVNTPEIEVSSSDQRTTSSRQRRQGRFRGRQSDIDEQEAIMRDYIANMAMDDSEESGEKIQPPTQQQSRWAKPRKTETFRYYDGAGEEHVKVQIQSATKKPAKQDLDQAMDWNSEDLEDFDDISTTDEEVIEISQVLRHRERENGPQYLVTPVGLNASDAKWILHAKLVSKSAQREIAIFEEIQAMEFEEDETFDDEDVDDEGETTDEEAEEALNDLIDHIESEDDENTRILKHTAKMTDEQIARALAKQEELGMGGDELMLFSGDLEEDQGDATTDMDDAFRRNDNFVSFSIQQHTSNRTRSKRNKKNRDSFPSASAFADALDEDPYGGFDVMDFDRPSLRPKKKGRKSDFPYDLELEDDDLRNQLVSTWMKDRDKKAQRKQEKEEARQAAALQFADHSEPAAIKAEIRRFLLQEVDTLRLSPMESATRASVHRLAKALKLNSHSEGKDGSEKGRCPVLTKTFRTPSYTIDTIWEIDALLNTKKFFPKNAGSYKKDKVPRGTVRSMKMRQSGGVSGASYMNGEIVGASAPELGSDNKGRAMLEKMGWSSGMAIGAEGNKGSLEVVRHVFKTSRAGLG